MSKYNWMDPADVLAWVPVADKLGVSKVARSPGGFVMAFLQAKGDKALSPEWKRKRNAFVARHLAQVRKRNEPMFTDMGVPTRRHLALIMWAYTPQPARLRRVQEFLLSLRRR